MKVILTEDIDRLGKAGDVVAVKEGYARNFLIPKNKVRPATPNNMKIAQALKDKELKAREKQAEEAKTQAAKIASLSVTISVQAGEDDKLFGSVTSDMIAHSLEKEGIAVDKKDVLLDEPIKALGAYQIAIKLNPEVKANLRVWVVRE